MDQTQGCPYDSHPALGSSQFLHTLESTGLTVLAVSCQWPLCASVFACPSLEFKRVLGCKTSVIQNTLGSPGLVFLADTLFAHIQQASACFGGVVVGPPVLGHETLLTIA
jgi:hypothetical protein